jgi:hypothetical protein
MLYLTKFNIKKIKEEAIIKLNAAYIIRFFPFSLIRNLIPKIVIVIQTPSCIGRYELKI